MSSKVLHAALVFASIVSSQASIDVNLPSTVLSTSNVVQDNFAGLSLEFNVLNRLIGSTPDTIPLPVVNYLKHLRSRINSPFRLRVGGNSLDGSYFDPSASSMINFNLANASAGIQNVPVTYGPQVLSTLSKLATDVGGISHLLGLSLVFPSNDSNVALFARTAEHDLGSSLDGFLLGNEPDLYEENHKRPVNYTVAKYAVDLNKVAGDLGISGPVLGSPSVCCDHPNWALTDVLNATLNTPVNDMLKYTSIQHYAQQSCDSTGTNRWDISYFTNHSNVQTLATWQADGVTMARAAGKQVIMDEFNSASCGGEPGRSDTFAAAIWTVDFVLGLAVNNFTAAYIHTREAGITYNIFNPPANGSNPNAGWETGPQYYSLVLLSEAFSTNSSAGSTGTVVVDLNLDNPTSVAAYGLYDANALSSPPRTLVLFNFANGTASETFSLPPGLAPNNRLNTTVRTLTAPAWEEKSSALISYAGQTVDAAGTGTLTGTLSEQTLQCESGCDIVVPGPGVALVRLQASIAATSEKQKKKGSAGPVALLSLGRVWLSCLIPLGLALLAVI